MAHLKRGFVLFSLRNLLAHVMITNIQCSLGGIFYQRAKNSDKLDKRWPFMFSDIIHSLDLQKITMFGHQFTWLDSRPVCTYEKLDRVLVTTNKEYKFPLASLRALQRINAWSGHAQPLTDFDQTSQSSKHPKFKLELRWLTSEGFADLVKKVWAR